MSGAGDWPREITLELIFRQGQRERMYPRDPQQLTLPFALPEQRWWRDPVPEPLVRQFLRQGKRALPPEGTA